MKLYPTLKDSSVEKIFEWLKFVVRERTQDVQEFSNLKNIFILGRKVGKIPSASNDVAVDDKIGDVNYSATFLYILIDNAGTASWRRVALSSW